MTLSIGRSVFLAGAASLLAPVSASAQDVRDLDDATSDILIFEGEVTTIPAVYRYTIPANTSLRIDAVPTEDSGLDPTLTVTDVASGEVLAEDDDGGGGVASRTRVYSEAGQQVEITVSAFDQFSDDASSGPFRLELRPAVAHPQDTRAVTYGSVMEGMLGSGTSHLFTIEGEKGALLEVVLEAGDDGLDPMLSLFEGRGANGEPMSTNDDGGGGLNSLLRYVLPESGTYTIAAEPYGDSSGSYTLRVAPEREFVVQAPVQVLGLADRAYGRLGEGYESGSIDPSEITYQLTGEAIAAIRAGNGEVTFNMTTPLFEDDSFPSNVDSFLELGFETPLGFASLMSDDDGGEGLNARIAIDLTPVSGGDWLERLRLRASSIGAGGDFEVELVEGMQEVVEDDWEEEFVE